MKENKKASHGGGRGGQFQVRSQPESDPLKEMESRVFLRGAEQGSRPSARVSPGSGAPSQESRLSGLGGAAPAMMRIS